MGDYSSIICVNNVVVFASVICEVTGKKVVVHLAIVVDISPTWSLWDSISSCNRGFTVCNPGVSSPEAVLEHALLAKALALTQLIVVIAGSIGQPPVSVLWCNSILINWSCPLLSENAVLMAVPVELVSCSSTRIVNLGVICGFITSVVPHFFVHSEVFRLKESSLEDCSISLIPLAYKGSRSAFSVDFS